jgi:hypothetical protein
MMITEEMLFIIYTSTLSELSIKHIHSDREINTDAAKNTTMVRIALPKPTETGPIIWKSIEYYWLGVHPTG